MSQNVSLWNRVSTFFRSDSGGRATLVEQNGGAHGANGGGNLLAFRSTTRGLDKHQATQRLTELMDGLQTHFERQDERSQKLNESLDRVALMLAQLAEGQRAQGDHTRNIALHAENSARNSQRLSETLAQVPASLHAQAEALRSVAKQSQIATEADQQLTLSLERFGAAVDSLSASNQSQVATLERLNAAEREQRDALTLMIRAQNRRFIWTLAVIAALGLGTLGVLGYIVGHAH